MGFRVCVRTHVRASRWSAAHCEPAPEGRNMLAQDVRVCYETHFVREPVGKQLHNLSPGGATYTSPALPALGKVGRMIQVPEGRLSFVTARSRPPWEGYWGVPTEHCF